MKHIKKFNESLLSDDEFEKREKNKLDHSSEIYRLYGRGDAETYSDLHVIGSGDLDYVLKYYKIHTDKMKEHDPWVYSKLYVVKETNINETIPDDEIKLLLQSKKYNL